MTRPMQQYFKLHPETPPCNVAGDYRCSVHFNNKYRLNRAKEQIASPPARVESVISLTNDFLQNMNMSKVEKPIINDPKDIDYKTLKTNYSLADERDVVWMKFTKDGYLGVVATSNDINFDIPSNCSEYDEKVEVNNPYLNIKEKVWKYNSSGILVHQLNKEWDDSFVLVFLLVDIPSCYKRGDIERAIGNYLIDNEVPIIDFFSHNY